MPMRQILVLLLIVAVATAGFPGSIRAQGGRAGGADPSELFLNAYMSVQQGEKLEREGDLRQALERYRHAGALLDQLHSRFPQWQPLIVDYRKKRTSENIGRLAQRVGTAPEPAAAPHPGLIPPGGPAHAGADLDPPLPERDAYPNPSVSFSPGGGGLGMGYGGAVAATTPADEVDNYAGQIKRRIEQLQGELRDSRASLNAVRQEKEAMAVRLEGALRQLDRMKMGEAEAKSQLKQVQEAFQNAINDTGRDLESRQVMQSQIEQLQKALAEVRAERDAADEENTEVSRRLARARGNVTALTKERDTATQKIRDIEVRYTKAAKLAKELEEANKQIAALKQDQKTSQQASSAVASQLAETQKQMAVIAKERDVARTQVDKLNSELAGAQKQIASVSAERDQIAQQRDQALSDLEKAREAQKKVDRLIADNASLMQKLADAEKTIQQFNVEMPKKDSEIASLRKEMSSVKELLAATQRENAQFQSNMAMLQQQLDTTSSELAEMKVSGASAEEKRKFAEENDLLRGIVLRQLKEQARRDQAKRLVIQELQKLEVQSNVLMQQIDYLSQPVTKLTERERALFKQPQIEIADTPDSAAMAISIAAPKPGSPTAAVANAAATDTTETPGVANSNADAEGPIPVEDSGKSNPTPQRVSNPPTAPGSVPPASTAMSSEPLTLAPPDLAPPSPAAAPMELTKLTTSPGPASAGASPSPAVGNPPPSAGAGKPAGSTTPQVETTITPTVPDDLIPQARAAKEAFERGLYREAEKGYEKMLSKAPNNVYILSNLGVVRFRAGKMKLAEEAFKKAIAVAPEDTFSHCTLGIVYYQQGKYDEAITALTKALALNPKYAVAHNYLGITASQKGWQEAALKELETAISLDPNYADACFNIAVIYATQQPPNKELARKHYKRATDLGAEPDAALEQLIK